MEYTLYEEFPTDENLERIDLFRNPVNLIVASPSLAEFQNLESRIRRSTDKIKRVGYWPTLHKDEGYWLSPFSDEKALDRVLAEVEERTTQDQPILFHWDAEIPLKSPGRIILPTNFQKNKQRIKEFLEQHKSYGVDLVVSEWPNCLVPEQIQEFLGVSFNPEQYNFKKVKMLYTSFAKYFPGSSIPRTIFERLLEQEASRGIAKYGTHFSIALGCLSLGVFSHEPILSPKELHEDLSTLRRLGLNGVYIYRLGGVNKDIAQIMEDID